MSLRLRARKLLLSLLRKTADPPPDQRTVIRKLNDALVDLASREKHAKAEYMAKVAELVEARQMAGSGPWQASAATLKQTDGIISDAIQNFGKPKLALQESANAITAQGVYGDIELALQNVEWRREVNLSWLEFSRWGIQQLILICRLHYVKNPWIRRGIELSAAYVFGQGVELSSPDKDANEVLKQFRERNKVTLGQIALVEQEKRKSYDGNVFWCLFTDSQDTGQVNVRVIDATEIQEIVLNPEDASEPRYYKRVWTQRVFNELTGQFTNQGGEEWYPALNYEPTERPLIIGDKPVKWDSPVYHRKVGGVANWTFGCPRVYPAIDWAREGRRLLEACASVIQALSQIALDVETKGGQQAIEGIKMQMGTTVGPSSALWDQNPPAVSGSTFAHGPGMKMAAFKSRGMSTDPAEVKEYRNMAACALGIPPTWLADMETSNLSTAQTLDRPTELGFLLRQEEWQEDLVVMGKYALRASKGAPSGKLREALELRNADDIEIREAGRKMVQSHWIYEAAPENSKTIEVVCHFPAIREGDIPALVRATFESMAIDRQGIGHGLDEKTAYRQFCTLLGIDNADELTEKHYPEATYQRDRTAKPDPTAVPAPTPGTQPPVVKPEESARIREALRRVSKALTERENGHVHTS